MFSEWNGSDPDDVAGMWWLMHHTNSPKRRTISVAHYVDDSGSDDAAKFAVVGGPVLSWQQFFPFHYEWDRLVRAKHGIGHPIHMNEFARPHGKLAYLTDSQRRVLFEDLVRLINDSKAYSLTVFVRSEVFKKFFPPAEFKGLFGLISHAFFWCLLWNHALVEYWSSNVEKIAYVVAHGDTNGQMLEAHSAFLALAKRRRLGGWTGGMGFDTPSNVHALQAADVIAWSNRKNCLDEQFTDGFEPLRHLVEKIAIRSDGQKVGHIHQELERKHIEGLARSLKSSDEPFPKIGRLELTKWISALSSAHPRQMRTASERPMPLARPVSPFVLSFIQDCLRRLPRGN